MKVDRLLALKSFLVAACYNVSCALLYRSFHGTRLPNLPKLSLVKCWEADELSSLRVRLRIFRAREVEPYLLYHRQHRLIFMTQTRQKSGRNLSKHGQIYSVAKKSHQEPEIVQIATLLTVIEEPKLDFFLDVYV